MSSCSCDAEKADIEPTRELSVCVSLLMQSWCALGRSFSVDTKLHSLFLSLVSDSTVMLLVFIIVTLSSLSLPQ